MIRDKIVHAFDLFELSGVRIEGGLKRFADAGLADRVIFHQADAFEAVTGRYDLVYWDNALHHMMDTRAAVRWSKSVLKPGGVLVVNDYVGPNRFQWSERGLSWASHVRSILPAHFVRDAGEPSRLLRTCARPNADAIARTDPSESADSENIIDALRYEFPSGTLWWLGGYIYHLALADLIWNFDGTEDSPELAMCLAIDELLSSLGENHYAAFLAST